MPKLILKSPYLKCGGKGTASGYLCYIGTRDGVELVPDDRPAAKRQEQLIRALGRVKGKTVWISAQACEKAGG